MRRVSPHPRRLCGAMLLPKALGTALVALVESLAGILPKEREILAALVVLVIVARWSDVLTLGGLRNLNQGSAMPSVAAAQRAPLIFSPFLL